MCTMYGVRCTKVVVMLLSKVFRTPYIVHRTLAFQQTIKYIHGRLCNFGK
jgi:hypothetical protein